MGDRWTGPGAARGFAVPLSAGLAVWAASVVVPLLEVTNYLGVYVPYGLLVLVTAGTGLVQAAAAVLVVVGVYRLLRALELHLGAGRPAPTARVDVERPAAR